LRSNEGSTDDLDVDEINDLFALTDEVLALEARAAEHHEREVHRRSSGMIYAATGALVLGSATMLTLGILLGWLSGWGITALAITIAVGVLLAGAHAIAEPSGHRERVRSAVLALIPGLAVAGLAPGWLPWWISLIALVILLVIAATFAATVNIEQPDTSSDRN